MSNSEITVEHPDASGGNHEIRSSPEAAPFTEHEINSVIEAVREVSSGPESETLLDLEHFAADYWDASTMGPLNEKSLAAIARLRTYKPPPFPLWDRLPVNRRAAVLILLYADRGGDLRVVITMRAASLRSFSGQAAFPGGKADSVDETPYEIARREAWEEIGLPMDDSKIPSPFTIDELCYLPCSLARTGLVVRPCVALLHVDPSRNANSAEVPTVDESLIPRLDAKEVAAVFSAPFHNFLLAEDEDVVASKTAAGDSGGGGAGKASSSSTTTTTTKSKFPPGKWYEGTWTAYHGYRWRLHYFYVPVDRQRVTRPRGRREGGGQAALGEEEEEEQDATTRFKVWGMTGRILVDAAMVAYGETPEFEHNEHYGDEELIMSVAPQVIEGNVKL